MSGRSVQCPLCFAAYVPEEIASHAAGCSGAGSTAAASSGAFGLGSETMGSQPQKPEAKRRRCEEQRVTIFTIAWQLTQRLNEPVARGESVNDSINLPHGKSRCPICWRLFIAEKVDAHATKCDGAKRLKTADIFIKAFEPVHLIVNFDSAVAFLGRLRADIQRFGLDAARLRVVYHWTAVGNHGKIEDANFYVPKSGQVANGNVYGAGIYAAAGFATTRSYGNGAEKCILCLANAGRVYDNDSLGLKSSKQKGYDSACFWNTRGYVFFSSDQALPCFLVSERDHQQAEKRIERALIEIVQALSDISGAEHDSVNRFNPTISTRMQQGLLQSWLGRLRTLLGM